MIWVYFYKDMKFAIIEFNGDCKKISLILKGQNERLSVCVSRISVVILQITIIIKNKYIKNGIGK